MPALGHVPLMDYISIKTITSLGDYWSILVSGIDRGRIDGHLNIDRTGPFVPPLTIVGVGDAVVTDAMRIRLDGVSGVIGFLPVVVKKAVRRNWHTWSLSLDERRAMCAGDPEDVLIRGRHNLKVAEEIGALYELLTETDGRVSGGFDSRGNYFVNFTEPPTLGHKLFKARTPGGYGHLVGSARFIASMGDEVNRWLQLTPIT